MLEEIKNFSNLIFDFIFLGFIFIILSFISLGFLSLPIYGVMMYSIIKVHVYNEETNTLLFAFSTLKNNAKKIFSHNIFQIALFFMVSQLINYIAIASISLLFSIIYFPFIIIFWIIVLDKELKFFSYYKVTFVILFRFIVMLFVTFVCLCITIYLAGNYAHWLVIFFPFAIFYPFAKLYFSRTRVFIK